MLIRTHGTSKLRGLISAAGGFVKKERGVPFRTTLALPVVARLAAAVF